jgi:hypothetical protein
VASLYGQVMEAVALGLKFAAKNWKWFAIGGLVLSLWFMNGLRESAVLAQEAAEAKVAGLEEQVSFLHAAVDGQVKAIAEQNAQQEARRIDEARTEQINVRRYTDVQSMEKWIKELENAKPVDQGQLLSTAACDVLRSLYGPEACRPSADHH